MGAAVVMHHCAVAAVISKPPSNWKRPPGRPNHTWLRAIELDLNIGSLSRTLASNCGHGYAQEEYV